jgi:hypothetical protein
MMDYEEEEEEEEKYKVKHVSLFPPTSNAQPNPIPSLYDPYGYLHSAFNFSSDVHIPSCM